MRDIENEVESDDDLPGSDEEIEEEEYFEDLVYCFSDRLTA